MVIKILTAIFFSILELDEENLFAKTEFYP
jgi:hypothetical protein